MSATDLSALLPRFFTEHFGEQRDVSSHTITAYRDTFRLLLRFLQNTRRTKSSALPLSALCASSVLAFLNDLEQVRENSIRTRNARLAAIRSFVRYPVIISAPNSPK